MTVSTVPNIMQHRARRGMTRLAAAACALLALAAFAFAGPLDDANVRYKAGDYAGAMTLLQQAKSETPSDPHVYAALGKTYRRLGDDNAARESYAQLLALDPDLNSVSDKSGFLSAYQKLGGQVPSGAGQPMQSEQGGQPSGGATNLSAIVGELQNNSVFVFPGLQAQVDAGAISQAIERAKPTVVKVLVVAKLGGYKSRADLAADLHKRLNLSDNDVMLVATPAGISGWSGRLSSTQIEQSFQSAGIDAANGQGGLTGAIVAAVGSLSGAVVSDQRSDTGRGAGLLFAGLAAVGGFVGYRAYKRKKEMDAAREPVENLRQQVIANLSYVDGYLDLLPRGADSDQAKELRADAFTKLDTATGLLKTAKTPGELRQAEPLLSEALSEMTRCREAIDRATGGTGVAMALPDMPSLETDVQRAARYQRSEEVRSESERERLQADLNSVPVNERGVSFFSGQPMPASELVPVTIVVQGQKRTVLATRDEAGAIARGETPNVRVFRGEDGQYVPWYEYRAYDPYRDYYANYGLLAATSDLISLYALTSLLGPGLYVGYNPWGMAGFGWGMPVPAYGFPAYGYGPVYGGYESGYGGYTDAGYDGGASSGGDTTPPDNTGGMDFFGNNYNEQGGGFDTDTSGGFDSSDSGGGFDFGGGDSGGGDFGGGGGDFGGGGDW